MNKSVKIINNIQQLNSFFDKASPNQLGNNFYIDLSRGKFSVKSRFEEIGFTEVIIDNQLIGDSEKFLKLYLNLISDISIINNKRIWWCSEVASKNRLTSNLPELVFQYIQCVKTIDEIKFDRLIIIIPLKELNQSIYKYVKAKKKISIALSESFIIGYFYNNYLFLKILQILSLFIRGVHLFFKGIHTRKILKSIKRKITINDKKYYLIKSHLYEKSFDSHNNYNDQFFGRLPYFLKNKSDILFFVHTHGDYKKLLYKIKNNNKEIIIPYEYFIELKDIIFGIIKIIFSKVELKNIHFYDYDITDIFKKEFIRVGISLDHWLMYESTKYLSKHLQFDYAYLTYENIAWENMFIMSINRYSSNTKIIGCQHTVVPQAAAGMFITKNEIYIKPVPDKIITTGIETKRILIENGVYPDNLVQVGCALRYEYLESIKLKKRNMGNIIFIGLEGTPQVTFIINYILKSIKELRDYNFIIRTHPILPWDKIQKNIKYDINQFPNIMLSNNISLADDLIQANICIYWGSTVALEALSMGIPIIHYDMQTILSYDPLFRCNYLKWSVTDYDSISNVIEVINSLTDEEYQYQAFKAKDYVKSHFYPVTEKNMNKFIYS